MYRVKKRDGELVDFNISNIIAAIRKAREEPSARIVAILPDGGEKYMSLGIYE